MKAGPYLISLLIVVAGVPSSLAEPGPSSVTDLEVPSWTPASQLPFSCHQEFSAQLRDWVSRSCKTLTGSVDCRASGPRSDAGARARALQRQLLLDRFAARNKVGGISWRGCCQGRMDCEKALASVQFEVSRDGDRSRFEVRNSGEWRVLVSDRDLSGSLRQEVLESVLLHEMGHACQWYWITQPGADHDYPGYNEVLDSHVASCLRENLSVAKSDSIKGGRPVNFKSWMHEAFADAVFASHRSAPLQWAVSVRTLEDPNHPPFSAILPCVTKQREVRQALCP